MRTGSNEVLKARIRELLGQPRDEIQLAEMVLAAEIKANAIMDEQVYTGDWEARVRRQISPPESAESFIRDVHRRRAEWPAQLRARMQELRALTRDDDRAWAERVARILGNG